MESFRRFSNFDFPNVLKASFVGAKTVYGPDPRNIQACNFVDFYCSPFSNIKCKESDRVGDRLVPVNLPIWVRSMS